MIISDLNYLEVVAEASSVVGGGNYKEKLSKFKVLPVNITKKTNVSVLDQKAESTSVAITEHGDATAVSEAKNEATVVQFNY